ncbi:MAG: hypothetical protein Kow00109_26790 [Acidobacteriota bacterium]
MRAKQVLWWILLLPVQVGLLALLAAAELVRLLLLPFRSNPAASAPAAAPAPEGAARKCSVIVLNWNGKDLLEKSLPAVLEAVRYAGGGHQVLVVDNGSTDGSVSWLRERYPEVDVLELPENLGFGQGNNRGVAAARHDVVVLLNNDMIPERDFLPPLLAAFDRPEVFAVAAQVLFPPGRRREETGQTQGEFRRGFLHVAHGEIRPYHARRRVAPVLWAGGGASAFRRDRFLALGGFSRLFDPCYFEDTDLGYRAWRRGWHCLLAPESRVLHLHRSSTSRRFSAEELAALVEERRLWYLWANFQLRTLVGHFLAYPLNFYQFCRPRHWIRAWRRLPRVLGQRIREPRRRFSDRQILAFSSRPWSYYRRFPVPPPDPPPPVTPRRPRILVLSAYLPHLGTHGGAGRVFEFLRQSSRWNDITLVTFLEGDHERGFLAQAQSVCRRVEVVERRGYRPLSPFPYEPFEEFNVPGFRKRLEDLLCEEEFDLVHFEWTQMALYADLVEHLPKVLTEVEVNWAAHRTLLDVEPNPLRRVRLYYNMLQTLYREVEACRKMERVVCVTPEDASYLEGYVAKDRLRVLPTGVDVRRFAFEPAAFERGAVVFVGAFRHYPNVDAMKYFAREIFPVVAAEVPGAHLYIVGASPPEEIRKLAEHPQITVTGFVEDIREYYRRAQVVVVPLRTGVGIRGKVLEGWAVGKAMVATTLACQGLPAIHGENVLLADEPEAFARWTIALLRHPEFCVRLGRAGRRVVEEQYDWNRLGGRLQEIYEELLGKHRVPAGIESGDEGLREELGVRR